MDISLYQIVLLIHSVLRWAAVLLLLVVIARSARGLAQPHTTWTTTDLNLGRGLVATMHTQLLLGLLLYIHLSPITKVAFSNFGAAMKDSVLRFWAVEHIFTAILGIIIAQVTMILTKRAEEDRSRFKRATIGYIFAAIAIFAAIPWPFRSAIGRGLF